MAHTRDRSAPAPPSTPARLATHTFAVEGLDCAGCARKLERAVAEIDGVSEVCVLLAAERMRVELDPARVDPARVRAAAESAGFRVPDAGTPAAERPSIQPAARRAAVACAALVVAVLAVAVFGEWLGVFDAVTDRVPLPLGLLLVAVLGWRPLRGVVAAARQWRVTAHTLVTLGAVAALLVGQWITAAVVMVFMRVAERVERFAADRSRRALRELVELAPLEARVERGGIERSVPVAELGDGEVVIVRPGERVPVDGEVVDGHAALNQSALTGESLPVEVGPGAGVYAATLVHGGALRIRTTRVGGDTVFGRVLTMVEEGEAHRADVHRLADRFTGYYLPVVLLVAAATWFLRGDVLAVAAVLVVACSCAFALATPVAMIASITTAARRGLLVKGGRYLELLARADVLLLDKTGTVTAGHPRLTDIVPLGEVTEEEVLRLAAGAERYSEHPLAEAVRVAARERGVRVPEPDGFEALPGRGVRARIDGVSVEVGRGADLPPAVAAGLARLQEEGRSTFVVSRDGVPVGLCAAADPLRADVPAALAEARALGIRHIEVLTGDNERVAEALSRSLGVPARAGLLPEDKIRVVEEFRARGHVVVMVGDGVNDAPALARADVGIAMGIAGTDVAVEVAPLVLMREEWSLVPEAIRVARRTMGVVRLNLLYTAAYNTAGLALAAFGLIPPIVAAAAHSIPDLAILANSSRLLRTRPEPAAEPAVGESERPVAGVLVAS
jgi:P-type Cu+ transporter